MAGFEAFPGWAARRLASLAPQPLRSLLESDGVRALEDRCAQARATRSSGRFLWLALTELASVALAVIRARVGGAAPISSVSLTAVSSPQRKDPRHMRRLGHDLRLALRQLRAARGSAAIAIGTLALGIGVTSAVFSILDATMIRPVPFANAARLHEIRNFELKSQVSHPGFGRALMAAWRQQTDLFERVEGFDVTSFVYETAAGAEMVTGAVVSPGLLSMLGATPLVGRLLTEGDGRGGTELRIVIGEAFWSRWFLRDPAVIGRDLALNGRRYAVVGVMPDSFRFPSGAASFWVPQDLDAPPSPGAGSLSRLGALALRRSDVTAEAATEQVRARGAALVGATGGPADRTAVLSLFGQDLDRRMRLSLQVLGAAVAFLLLIVCANLANLSLSRALVRARDYAVRASLGASRGDLVRETLVEHLIVGTAGAIAGLAVAAVVLNLTLNLLPRGFQVYAMNAIDLDMRAVGFTALAGVVAAILFGLPPAWLASRGRVTDLLKSDSRSSAGSTAARRLRRVLVIAEVTLAIVLLVGAALMARSLVKLQHVDRGFDSAGLLALRIGLPANGYADVYARDAFVAQLIDRASQLPGVTAVTAGGVPPDGGMMAFGKVERSDRPGELSDDLIVPLYEVWPNYFGAVGIPLKAGRGFTDEEPADSIVVSESFAAKFWPNTSAIGHRMRFEGDEWRTIVGVAGEVRQLSLDDSTGSHELYQPLKHPRGVPPPKNFRSGAIVAYRTLVVRAHDVEKTMAALSGVVHETDKRVVIWRAETVDRLFADAIARPRLVLLLMTVFAGLGLVLAAAGIYGVLSYAVIQRRREIGIRLALGARPDAVGRAVVGQGLALTAIGLAIGVALAMALMGVMRSLLYDVEPTDPFSVATVAMVLLGVALVASWQPARRAMRIDPVRLLREE